MPAGRRADIKFHDVIHNVPSLCHFQALFSRREQTCHAFTQAARSDGVSRRSQKHILHVGTYWCWQSICACMLACERPGEYWSAEEVKDDLFPPNATGLRHFVQAPAAGVIGEVLRTRCRAPRGSLLWNWTRLSTQSSHKVPARLTGSIRNIYRTDILTTVNDNRLPSSKCGRWNRTARWEKNESVLVRPSVSVLCPKIRLARYINLIVQWTVS